jgi:hypothetical protein
MRKKYFLLLIPIVLILPAAAEMSVSKSCDQVGLYPDSIESPYPAHEFSPKEALDTYDYAFLGRVLVPTRKCSLGYCAGIKIMKNIKGRAPTKNLIRISHSDPQCLPHKFAHKGASWMIFASSGTTPKGTKYLQIESDGPSYTTRLIPNFDVLEHRYDLMRASLDRAISEKIR